MTRRHIFISFGFLVSGFILYAIFSMLQLETASNLTSALMSLTAAVLIFRNTRKEYYYYLSWKLMGLAAMSWAVCDAVWLVMSLLPQGDPRNSDWLNLAYALPNLFLTAACITHFKRCAIVWHKLLIWTDLVAVALASGLIYWFVIVTPLWDHPLAPLPMLTIFLSIITDFTCIAVIFMLYNATRGLVHDVPLAVMIGGILIYNFNDIFYMYSDIHNTYVPNQLSDVIYLLGFVIFASAALVKRGWFDDVSGKDLLTPQGTSRNYKYLWLFAVPLLLFAFGLYPWYVLIHILAILAVHRIVTQYIHIAIHQEDLRMREHQLNENLEIQVQERTRALREANQHLSDITRLDALTGLFNRRYFLDLLNAWTVHPDKPFTVFYMDLDRFKSVNDSYGHPMGDAVLKEIADRFRVMSQGRHIFARLGGDEFVMMMAGTLENDAASAVARELFQLVSKPVTIGDYAFHLGVSTGIARFPGDSTQCMELLKFADMAMYAAKKHQAFDERFAIYREELVEIASRSRRLELSLRSAEYDKEFELYYQPQFSLSDGALVGMEALIRWTSPHEGPVSPAEFIPVAEETGLIIPISHWVSSHAIEKIRHWNTQYQRQLVMGINISPKYMDIRDFVLKAERYIKKLGVNPSWLDFEITESSAMSRATDMEDILTGLNSIGISVSIDDFGTGYSSLSYIKRFDVDRLKIARELIEQIVEKPDDRMIVRAIVMMSKGMGIRTIAEGVETAEQLDLLREIGCDEVQGYFLSRPLPAGVFEEKYLRSAP